MRCTSPPPTAAWSAACRSAARSAFSSGSDFMQPMGGLRLISVRGDQSGLFGFTGLLTCWSQRASSARHTIPSRWRGQMRCSGGGQGWGERPATQPLGLTQATQWVNTLRGERQSNNHSGLNSDLRATCYLGKRPSIHAHEWLRYRREAINRQSIPPALDTITIEGDSVGLVGCA